MFCENETNSERLFGSGNASPHTKDAINEFVVSGTADAVNPERTGTKAAARHVLTIASGAKASIRLRLPASSETGTVELPQGEALGADFDRVLAARRSEADQFYATVIPPSLPADGAMVMRQALAGLLWSKQYYEYNVHRWLREHDVNPWNPNAPASSVRNVPWFHMVAGDVISMPDKWEYPWYAAWDLAFHMIPVFAHRSPISRKGQLQLFLRRIWYMHPNGQIPAYEWNFSDVNPPVTAWAALYVYEREAEIRGEGDAEFLARVFERLLTNFTWWVNRKDPDDRNLFQGGFLGLDNIGIFDRSAPLPGGGTLEQADGTAWMALYCQWMLQIAVELAKTNPVYRDIALKFIAHFEWISIAMDPPGGDTALWDDEDGFYYDVMRMPDGAAIQLKVRSIVGLLPLCALRPSSTRTCSRAIPTWWRAPRSSFARLPTTSRRSRTNPVEVPKAGRSCRSSTSRGYGGSSRSCSTRTSSSARTGSVRSRAVISSTRASSSGRVRSTTSTTSPPSRTQACSAGTRTGAARSGSRSTWSSCGDWFSCTASTATG